MGREAGPEQQRQPPLVAWVSVRSRLVFPGVAVPSNDKDSYQLFKNISK